MVLASQAEIPTPTTPARAWVSGRRCDQPHHGERSRRRQRRNQGQGQVPGDSEGDQEDQPRHDALRNALDTAGALEDIDASVMGAVQPGFGGVALRKAGHGGLLLCRL